jgi:signal transduction histidine kinase
MRVRPWQWTALDCLVAVLIVVVLFAAVRPTLRSVAVSAVGPPIVHYYRPAVATPVVLFLVAAAGFATALRRHRPMLMLGVLLIGSLLATVLTYRDFSSLTFFVPVAYVLYLIAANYERRRDAVWVLAAVFATILFDTELSTLAYGSLDKGAPLLVILLVIIGWTAGYATRQRRSYAVRLQEEAASKAVAEERLRIARELHDVVAHSMSVIAVQAGYGQYVIDTQPADARSALGAIQVTSREALEEMRRMLGALRHAVEADAAEAGAAAAPADESLPADPAGAPLFPAPGLADLDRLLSRTASAGVQVNVKRLGLAMDLPASLDLSAYRIIQEALTNVVKHAHTSSCQVLIGYGLDELLVEITDNGAGLPELAGAGARTVLGGHNGSAAAAFDRGSVNRGPLDAGALDGGRLEAADLAGVGGGHGIIGMRERVSLLGGVFSAGPLPGYGFRVSARVPLRAGEGR